MGVTQQRVAIGVPVVALAAVLVAQGVTPCDEGSRRRDEQTRSVRVDICDPCEDQWDKVATPLPQVWQGCWRLARTAMAKMLEKPRESAIAS